MRSEWIINTEPFIFKPGLNTIINPDFVKENL